MSALPAAMAAVAAAMQGFPALFTSNHTSHYQSDNTRQNRKYYDCSHTSVSFSAYLAFTFTSLFVSICSVLLSL